MKRKRYLIDDSIYPIFVTSTIVQWVPVFGYDNIAIEALKIFEIIRADLKASIFGYALMPSHLHAVIKTSNKGDLSILMRKWKSLSAKMILEQAANHHEDWLHIFKENARQYNRLNIENHQVWQPRFDDFAIRTEEQFLTKINYIHTNPVRDGLVGKMEEYRFSSIHDYSFDKNGYVTITLWSH